MRGRCTKSGREKGAGEEKTWCKEARKPIECVGDAPSPEGKRAPAKQKPVHCTETCGTPVLFFYKSV